MTVDHVLEAPSVERADWWYRLAWVVQKTRQEAHWDSLDVVATTGVHAGVATMVAYTRKRVEESPQVGGEFV